MNTIAKDEIFKITKVYCEKKFEKDSVDFTDEEEMFFNGYTAGMLDGVRLTGANVSDL